MQKPLFINHGGKVLISSIRFFHKSKYRYDLTLAADRLSATVTQVAKPSPA